MLLSKYQFRLKFILILRVLYEGSYSKKYQDHILCSFAYKLVCVDDKFSKSIVVFRGKIAASEFIKTILKEY